MKRGERLKYLKATYKYLWDKGPYLVLISIIPSLLMPFLFSPSSTLYYLCQFKNIDSSNFAALIRDMRALPYDFWYLGLVGAILIIFAISILFGVIDKHMRTGEFNVKLSSVKSRINFNIITTLKFMFYTLFMFEFLNLLTAALYYFWGVVFESQNCLACVFNYNLSCNSAFLLHTNGFCIIVASFYVAYWNEIKRCIQNGMETNEWKVYIYCCIFDINYITISNNNDYYRKLKLWSDC